MFDSICLCSFVIFCIYTGPCLVWTALWWTKQERVSFFLVLVIYVNFHNHIWKTSIRAILVINDEYFKSEVLSSKDQNTYVSIFLIGKRNCYRHPNSIFATYELVFRYTIFISIIEIMSFSHKGLLQYFIHYTDINFIYIYICLIFETLVLKLIIMIKIYQNKFVISVYIGAA